MERTRLALALALTLTAGGCASVPERPPEADGAVRLAPPDKSIFIRASFDQDPSDYLGRFLPAGIATEAIDETAARVSSRCGKYLKAKTVKASGSYEQTFNASSGVKGSLGVQPFGKASAGSTGEAGLLVKYTMTEKMLVTVADADGFARCCESAPGECGERMIGEFIRGTGSVSENAGVDTSAEAGGSYKKVDAELSYKDGFAWKRVSTFEDAYFAFRTVAGPQAGAAAGGVCETAWAREVPQSLDGQYFVGAAGVLAPESKAREDAMRNARREVVKYIGEKIAESYEGRSSVIGGALADETLVKAAAEGVAKRVRARCWSDAVVQPTPEGPFTEIRVLAFLPAEEEAATQSEAVEAMAVQAEAEKKPEVARELRKVKKGGEQ